MFVQRLTHSNCLCCSNCCVSYQNYCCVAQMFQMSPFGALECSLTARRAATFISHLRSNFTFNPQLETTDSVIAAEKQGAKNKTMHRCEMPRTHLPRTRTCYPSNFAHLRYLKVEMQKEKVHLASQPPAQVCTNKSTSREKMNHGVIQQNKMQADEKAVAEKS